MFLKVIEIDSKKEIQNIIKQLLIIQKNGVDFTADNIQLIEDSVQKLEEIKLYIICFMTHEEKVKLQKITLGDEE